MVKFPALRLLHRNIVYIGENTKIKKFEITKDFFTYVCSVLVEVLEFQQLEKNNKDMI